MEVWGGNRPIQSGISVPGIDAWVLSDPCGNDPGGGDIYYVSMCGGGRIARFMVADVSGHGEAVSELAVKLRTLMRRHVNKLDQTRLVRSLNRGFARLGRADKFATAVLTSYFAPTDHLVICNAGHPPPLWYRARTGTWCVLAHEMPERLESSSNLPLGIVHPTSYHQFAVKLELHDLVLIYTDGLIEARDQDGNLLEESGLMKIVRSLDATNPNQFCEALLAEVARFCDQRPFDDDVTVVLLHHNAADPPPLTLAHRMKMLGKMMRF